MLKFQHNANNVQVLEVDMSFQKIVESAKLYFPELQVKYKNQSYFMKLIGLLLFFNKNFMTTYTTTIGPTIYFTNESFIKAHPISAMIILLHELVHMHDAKKINKFIFGFLYLTPQILFVLALPLLLVSWKLALLFMLFALPIPSYFRMYFEKRAYISSLYAMSKLGNKLHFNSNLIEQKEYFLKQFSGSYYYFMWPFNNLDAEFDAAIDKINKNEKPFEDEVFNKLDNIISAL